LRQIYYKGVLLPEKCGYQAARFEAFPGARKNGSRAKVSGGLMCDKTESPAYRRCRRRWSIALSS
jgi:hypothetical protein